MMFFSNKTLYYLENKIKNNIIERNFVNHTLQEFLEDTALHQKKLSDP